VTKNLKKSKFSKTERLAILAKVDSGTGIDEILPGTPGPCGDPIQMAQGTSRHAGRDQTV